VLTEKYWRFEAIARLFGAIFICMFAGSLVVGVCQQFPVHAADKRFLLMAATALVCLAGSLVLLRHKWPREKLVTRIAYFLVLFYAGIVLGMLAQKDIGGIRPSTLQMFVGTISIQGAALVFAVVFVHEHGVTLDKAFGFSLEPTRALTFGFLAACFFLPLAMAMQWGSIQILEHLPWRGFKPEEQEAVQALRTAVSWPERFGLGVVTIVLAPIAEEILFRGIIYPAVKMAGFPRLALWGTSVLFALIHFNVAIFVPLVVLAICLTVLYEKTGNLLSSITTHALFNAVNFTLLYTTQISKP
jgi:membrane protease YdiL (CAAX protease family)